MGWRTCTEDKFFEWAVNVSFCAHLSPNAGGLDGASLSRSLDGRYSSESGLRP